MIVAHYTMLLLPQKGSVYLRAKIDYAAFGFMAGELVVENNMEKRLASQLVAAFHCAIWRQDRSVDITTSTSSQPTN